MALREDVHVGDWVRITGQLFCAQIEDLGEHVAKVRDQNGIVSYPPIEKIWVEHRVPR